jgi:hypothetical protein
MKKLMLAGVLLTVITLPVFAKTVAVVEKIQISNAVKKVTQTRDGKETNLGEKQAVEFNDVINSGDNIVSLKMDDASIWTLEEKTTFTVHSAEENKPVYELLVGSANYSAAEGVGEVLVKINNKVFMVSAKAKINFAYLDTEKMIELKVTEGTVKFGNQVFDKEVTVRIDEQGKATTFKLRGFRG